MRKDFDEEVSRQMSQKASGTERPPTPRPPASSADMKVARMVLNRKGPKAKTRRTLLDRLRLGSAQRAAKRASVQDPNLPSRATKIGKMFNPGTGEHEEVVLDVQRPRLERSYTLGSAMRSL